MMYPRLLLIGNFISQHGHTPQMGEFLARNFTNMAIPVITTSHFKSKPLRFMGMMCTIIFKRNKYDCVLIELFSGPAFYWGFCSGILLKLLHKPYMLDLRGGNLPPFSEKHTFLFSFLLSHAAKIISPSFYLQSWALRFTKLCQIIPNPIMLENYTFKKRNTFRPRLFWLRRFHNIYNPLMAVKLIAELKKQYPHCLLTMAGPDSGAFKSCKSLTKELGLENNILFPGRLSKKEINQEGMRHDFFINTSKIDNTPFTLIEAAAMGLLLISTNAGGIPQLFKHNNEAFLFSIDDYSAMAQKITEIIKNPEAGTLVLTCARKSVEHYSWDKVKLLWSDLFKGLKA
ncbi:MAG: glycosyltransferase [Fibrobacteria bacterium]|nr:glycosyltransferase [Fibrobacteria bacterium]